MNYLKINEKILKHSLKNKKRITLSLIVAFLITGGIDFVGEEVFARDLRARKRSANNIKPDTGGPSMSTSANGNDLINIVKPDSNGLSHNKFVDFSVGSENSAIFNNNATGAPVVSKTGGIVTHNPNLSQEGKPGTAAKAILTEVTGNKISNIDGTVEIAGQKADFILANENGISVNGGGFINTSGVTLTTGKPSVSGNDLNLNVTKGKVTIGEVGAGTAGDYFNVIAKTIELKGQIAAFEGEQDADITLIAGQNKVNLKDRKTPNVEKILGNDKTDTKYGIYANNLGAMYGRNIKMISTTEGLGVRHEGLIRSSGDIEIQSNGDIAIGGLNAGKSIKMKAKGDFSTINGAYELDKVKYNYSILANNGVNIAVDGNIVIESAVSATGEEGIKFTAKNLRINGNGKTTAAIVSNAGLTMKISGDINIETLMRPVMAGRNPSKPPLLVLKDVNGNVKVVDPETNRTLNENEYRWESDGIYAQNIDIEGNNIKNEAIIRNLREYRQNKIKIKANNLENSNIIASSGDLEINAKKITNSKMINDKLQEKNITGSMSGAKVVINTEEITNEGEIRQNTHTKGEAVDLYNGLTINIKNGSFSNTGVVSGYNIEIKGENFNLVNDKGATIVAADRVYPYGAGNIKISAASISNKGSILTGGLGDSNNIEITAQTLNNLGYIIAQKGNTSINAKGDISNQGEIIGNNVTIKSEKDFVNYGMVSAMEKVLIQVNKFLNAGYDPSGASLLEQYLTEFYKLTNESVTDAENMILDIEDRLKRVTDPKEREILEAKKAHLVAVKADLEKLTEDLKMVSFGTVAGKDIDITTTGTRATGKTNDNLDNSGIIKAENKLNINSAAGITNNGIIEASKELTMKAGGDIENTRRIYGGDKATIEGKSFSSVGGEDALKEYTEALSEYESKLKEYGVSKFEDFDVKIKALEAQLQKETDAKKIADLSKQIETLRKQKWDVSVKKAELSSLRFGIVESKDLTINVKDKIDNQGIIGASESLKLKSESGDIDNTGIIIANKADIDAGKDINNSGIINIDNNLNLSAKGNVTSNGTITVGENLTGKIINNFEIDSLKVGKNIDLETGNAKFKKELEVGGDAKITLTGTDQNVEINGTANIVKSLDIKGGGLSNTGTTTIGENLKIDKGNSNSSFSNTGDLNVAKDTNILTKGFNNANKLITGGTLDINAGNEKLVNSGNLQAGSKVNITSNGVENSGTAIFGGDTTINAGNGDILNESLEVTGDLNITTTGNLTNNTKLQNTKNLTVSAKDFANKGNILNAGSDITASGNISNTANASIESTGNLTLKGSQNMTNEGKIVTTGNGKVEVAGNLENTGFLAAGTSKDRNDSGNLIVSAGKVDNKNNGTIQAEKKLDLKITKGFNNSQGANILGGDISIDGKASTLNTNFENKGNIISNGTLKVDLGNNQKDIIIGETGKLSSQKLMTLVTGGNINNSGKFQNYGPLDFSAGKDITNTGMLVSNGDIKLKAQNISNIGTDKGGSTIWANGKITLEADKNVLNKNHSVIESKGDMAITAETLLNEASKIQSGGKLTIKADKVENKTIYQDAGTSYYTLEIKDNWETGWGDSTYEHKFSMTMKIPIFQANNVNIKSEDRGFISSRGDLAISGKSKETSDVVNSAGTIQTSSNMKITGNIRNESAATTKSLIEILDSIKVSLYWRNHGWVVGSPIYQSGTTYEDKSLLEVMREIANNTATGYYSQIDVGTLVALKGVYNSGNTEIQEILNTVFGSSAWITYNVETFNKNVDINFSGTKHYYIANGNANILAGGSFTQEKGTLINGGSGDVGGNKSVTVNIGGQQVDASTGNLGVTISDPNQITEVDGVKTVHKVEIQKGEVTINGVTISSSTGGTISSIAVAGTINPVIYIEIPTGENGVFRPATPKPGERVPYKYETNLEFIDLSKYYGSDYLFKQIGYDPDKTPTVIGDAYYEKELIDRSIREGLGYAGEITNDNVKSLLDNGALVSKDLGLVLGMPLTPEQINKLEKDIIWYVEMEVDGDIVLVPQVYFGKETRIKMAESDKGGGAGSNIKVDGDINIDAENVVNSNGNIIGGGNVNIKSENDIINNATGGFNGGIAAGGDISLDAKNNINMQGGTVKGDGDINLKAGNEVNIESGIGYDDKGNQIISNNAGIQGKGNISVDAEKDVNLKGAFIEGTGEGSVNISGENVNITDQNLISSESKKTDNSSYSSVSSKSSGSTVAGENINIKSKNDINIKGSNVVAGDEANLEAGNNVNITDGKDYSHETGESSFVGFKNGLLTVESSSFEETKSTSVGSTVGGVGGLNVKAGGDTTIQGSDLIAGEKGINIKSEGNVNILDGQDTISGKSSSSSFGTISYTSSNEEYKGTTSTKSSLSSMGDLNIEAGGNVKVVGSDIASLGDTNIKVGDGKEVKFEAGKNTYEHSSNSITVGVTSADASAGAGGASAKASWNHVDGGSTEVITGDAVQVAKDSQNKNGKLGKNYMDSLTSAQTTVGVSVKNSSEKSTTWSKGNVSTGGNLNITSGNDDNSRGTVDIGGADFTTGGDFNITAKQIDTTKYTDVTEKTNSDFSLGVKVSNSTTSSIADAVNKGMQIAETAADPEKSLNAGLTAAQVAGTATNLIFGDLAANTTSVTGELGYSESSSKHTKENETVIQSGGKINFKTTDGDINLNGVQMKGNEVVLDADEKHNININSAKETYTENSFSINASGGVTASAGVGAIDGGNAQLGVTGNASFSKSDVNNEYSHGSVIEAGNVELKGKDVNLKGSNIVADNLHTELKGNVNVTTEADKYDESRIEAWAGVDGSLGVASNTIGTGDLGVSAGGGQIYKKGDVINNQAGIVVKNDITGTIEGDLNLKGGVFGSETGNANGNLTIGGNVNVEDVKSNLEAGGAIVGGNIGSKGGGIQGEVGDVIDLEKTAKGTVALNPGNTQIGGDVTVNGESAQDITRDNDPLKGVNTDLSNSLTTDKDVYEGGGTFSGTASVPSFGSKKKGDNDKPVVDLVDGNSTKVITGKVEGGPSYPEISTSPQPNKGVVDKGGSNVPELKLPTTEPPVKLPVPEIKKPDTVDGGSIKGNVVTEPNIKKIPEVTGGNGSVKGNTENVAVGGYVKNPETGKWESASGSKPGAILTGGAITNKNALDGFQKGAESLNPRSGKLVK